MDDVKVHRNSDKPAQLQAHAYAQGTDIHLGPGQEKHLPHEAWHVVQQKQGRVKPTKQLKSKVNVNDDAGLEKEADVMGARAAVFSDPNKNKSAKASTAPRTNVQQLMPEGESETDDVPHNRGMVKFHFAGSGEMRPLLHQQKDKKQKTGGNKKGTEDKYTAAQEGPPGKMTKKTPAKNKTTFEYRGPMGGFGAGGQGARDAGANNTGVNMEDALIELEAECIAMSENKTPVTRIEVVGFSRGAATASTFSVEAKKVAEKYTSEKVTVQSLLQDPVPGNKGQMLLRAPGTEGHQSYEQDVSTLYDETDQKEDLSALNSGTTMIMPIKSNHGNIKFVSQFVSGWQTFILIVGPMASHQSGGGTPETGTIVYGGHELRGMQIAKTIPKGFYYGVHDGPQIEIKAMDVAGWHKWVQPRMDEASKFYKSDDWEKRFANVKKAAANAGLFLRDTKAQKLKD